MIKKSIDFLGYKISPLDVADIEESALAKIQERASYIYSSQRSATVATAWIEATLNYLYNRAQQEQSND